MVLVPRAVFFDQIYRLRSRRAILSLFRPTNSTRGPHLDVNNWRNDRRTTISLTPPIHVAVHSPCCGVTREARIFNLSNSWTMTFTVACWPLSFELHRLVAL